MTLDTALRSAPVLAGDDPSLPDDDLLPLLERLRGAQLVGLGEETHGTREVFRLKHRIFRGLVERCGATMLLLEAGAAECEALDRYVLTGQGSAEDALPEQRFWTWDTDEVLELVEWMRAYNEANGPVLRLRGVDGQFPSRALAAVLAAMPQPLAERFARELVVLADDVVVESLPHLDPAHLDQVVTSAELLVASAPDRRTRALARTVLSAARQRRDPSTAIAVRDEAMAQAVLTVLDEQPGVVAAFWAHNGHVGRVPFQDDVLPAGGHLARALGSRYAVVGFASGEGETSALGPQSTPLPVALPELPPDALPRRIGSGIRWIDVATLPAPPVRERMIGAFVPPTPDEQLREISLAAAYDVLVTVERGTASRLRPTAARVGTAPWPLLTSPEQSTEAPLPGGLWPMTTAPAGACEITPDGSGVLLRTGQPWGIARVGRRWAADGPVLVRSQVRLLEGSPAVHVVVVQRDAEGLVLRWQCETPGEDVLVEPHPDATVVSASVAASGAGTVLVEELLTAVRREVLL